MNSAIVSGYLLKGAEFTCTPAGVRKLEFESMLKAPGDAEATPWHCVIEDQATMHAAEPLLTPGRGVLLRAQLAGRPFMKNGVRSGFIRYLRVMEVQFIRSDRAGVRLKADDAEVPVATSEAQP